MGSHDHAYSTYILYRLLKLNNWFIEHIETTIVLQQVIVYIWLLYSAQQHHYTPVSEEQG